MLASSCFTWQICARRINVSRRSVDMGWRPAPGGNQICSDWFALPPAQKRNECYVFCRGCPPGAEAVVKPEREIASSRTRQRQSTRTPLVRHRRRVFTITRRASNDKDESSK